MYEIVEVYLPTYIILHTKQYLCRFMPNSQSMTEKIIKNRLHNIFASTSHALSSGHVASKSHQYLCLAYGEQLALTGVWLNHNSVAGTGKFTLERT